MSSNNVQNKSLLSKAGWGVVAVIGAFALGYIALKRGESINALWVLTAAICVYLIGYRFYALYISDNALMTDKTRLTPAFRHNDGLDYVPTNKVILFGHHFAAIAGAGPLVGPVLAAQMGYLPGMLWLLIGVVLAGAVQDFLVLFVSTRRDGRSLGELIKQEMGTTAGVIGLIACFMIMTIILAILAIVVVKALAHSPWGTFAIGFTIPLALIMGIYLKFIRPGRILEISVIGFIGLIAGIILGGQVAQSETLAPIFDLSGVQLTWIIICYGFIASVIPVWLLLAPRDYLSTFLKIGVIVGLALGIVIVMPMLEMPALTKYAFSDHGPVWTGSLFPFLFITIACGAVSGFHALISSGTTPKMLPNEKDARIIGYGGMLMESFVGIMALIAASIINPGIYFSINTSLAALNPQGLQDIALAASQTVSSWGFSVTPDDLTQLASDVGENSVIARTGGAPTLAVGMAIIIHKVFESIGSTMAFWYHFAILFEALFILTAVDAGTRAARFMLQDLLGLINPNLKRTNSIFANLLATTLVVAAWGYFLYVGVVDPFGGINTLWPLFGISNQMLAAIALMLCTVVMFKMKRHQYAWIPILPTVWLLICTMTAGWQKAFSADPAISFFAKANQLSGKLANFVPDSTFKTQEQLKQVIFNNQLDGILTIVFMVVVVAIGFFTIKSCIEGYKNPKPSSKEIPYEPMPANAQEILKGTAH
jgi:carbon starvation protein